MDKQDVTLISMVITVKLHHHWWEIGTAVVSRNVVV